MTNSSPTSRSSRLRLRLITNPSRPTRPTRLRLITNPSLPTSPSHQHRYLLIYYIHSLLYCHNRYFLTQPLLTYCRPRYIFFAQYGGRERGVPVVQFNESP